MAIFNSYVKLQEGYPLLFQQLPPMIWKVQHLKSQAETTSELELKLQAPGRDLIHGAHQKSLTLVLENWWSHGMPWPSAEVSWGRRAPKSIGFLLKTSKNRSFWMILGPPFVRTPQRRTTAMDRWGIPLPSVVASFRQRRDASKSWKHRLDAWEIEMVSPPILL